MASLKALIDAQCLLIKKLLQSTMTAVTAHTDTHAHVRSNSKGAIERKPRGRVRRRLKKKKKMTPTSTGGDQHPH